MQNMDVKSDVDIINSESSTSSSSSTTTTPSIHSSPTPHLVTNFFDNLDFLQKEWQKLEMKHARLLEENQQLNESLEREISKNSSCQKQVKFIQDNQKSFEKLKRIYLATKSGKDARNSNPSLEEKSSQTIDNDKELDFKKDEVDKALKMVEQIKLMVKKYDITRAMNQYNGNELAKNYTKLEKENALLKTYLQAKNLEMEALKTDEKLIEQCVNENKLLRRLLHKFDRHMRIAERTFRPVKYPELKDDEKELINYTNDRYTTKSTQILHDTDSQQRTNKKTNNELLSVSIDDVLRSLKKPKTPIRDKTLDMIEKLRVFQPEFNPDDSNVSSRGDKPKTYYPCDKLQNAFITKVMSSTSCKNNRKR